MIKFKWMEKELDTREAFPDFLATIGEIDGANSDANFERRDDTAGFWTDA